LRGFGWGNRRPLAIRNVHEFAQENLVLAAYNNILLRLLERLCLSLLSLVLFHVGIDDLSLSRFEHCMCCLAFRRVTNLRNLVQLGLVDALMAAEGCVR